MRVGLANGCGVTDVGHVICWGGATGVGGGPLVSPAPPTTVLVAPGVPLAGVRTVDVGAGFACAVLNDGQVWCWGSGEYGKLGDGRATFSSYAVHARAVGAPLDDAIDVSAGHVSACAVRRSGRVVCWGMNRYGELGDGSSVERDEGVEVLDAATGTPLEGAVSVAVGDYLACAIVVGGEVRCWGASGFLGNGAPGGFTAHPVAEAVAGVGGTGRLTGARQVSIGRFDPCVAGSFGIVCWGDGSFGQLGDGAMSGAAFPTLVPAPP